MLGWGEIAIIIIGAIILLGPEKLTDFARELGKLYGEYKKAMRMIELEYIYGVKQISDEELEENLREKQQQLIDEIKKLNSD
ncbi:MAG: twin-arginine translocase TatA/TatE family subunit [Archaeoglobus sp.]|uniref:twin-arginine translocase TatA/TatE family subunit n=1 Tax=Archaeoglobus sp. TaxID=1872626 RepID=UPI001E149C44|nr:twin-arginine translocase TatA/TatE family subunit [Archaeoglobus sp.]MBO8179223.1 twin-arginine translocase TatA/TatE family subunit [Archaeoglobus sp.]